MVRLAASALSLCLLTACSAAPNPTPSLKPVTISLAPDAKDSDAEPQEIVIAGDDLVHTAEGVKIPDGWLPAPMSPLAGALVCGMSEKWELDQHRTLRTLSVDPLPRTLPAGARFAELVQQHAHSQGAHQVHVHEKGVDIMTDISTPAAPLSARTAVAVAKLPPAVSQWVTLARKHIASPPHFVRYDVDAEGQITIVIGHRAELATIAHRLNSTAFDRARKHFERRVDAWTVHVFGTRMGEVEEVGIRVSNIDLERDPKVESCDGDDFDDFDDDDDEDDFE